MIIVLLVVLGLILGSFVNALTWRFHEQAELAGKKGAKAQEQRRKLSMLHGRSMCSNCGHELAVIDLIPLFSWLWLRGRCRYCRAKIQDSPLTEVAPAVLFVASYLWWPLSFHGVNLFQFIVWLVFMVAFVALAAYDFRWFLLPDRIVYPLIGLAATEVIIVAVAHRSISMGVNAAVAGLIISGIFYLLFQFSKGTWIGGGDVKLAAVLGLLAGTPLKALLVLFLSSVIGTLVSIPLLLKGKQGLKAHIPYGPFLLTATIVVVLFGSSLIDWYDRLLLR